jgi:hypothetical protein
MVFENKKYETMGEIFSLADSLAKEGVKSKCEHFLIAYATSILDANESVTNYEEALNIAKSNLGYFAGYFNSTTYERINRTYGVIHPVFKTNPFDIAPEEAYRMGLEMGKAM